MTQAASCKQSAGRLSDRVSAAVGLALYRITQESLANIAKHTLESKSTVTLEISRSTVKLAIVNELPLAVVADRPSDGRGVRGMRQRVELLGGVIDIGPSDGGWAVRAEDVLHTQSGRIAATGMSAQRALHRALHVALNHEGSNIRGG